MAYLEGAAEVARVVLAPCLRLAAVRVASPRERAARGIALLLKFLNIF
jgi:hypothetical protein